MENHTWQRSLDLLTEPLALIAIAMLFLNDHLLRIAFPSWITGKLGDLAWLYFAPLALTVPLVLVLPRISDRHPQLPIYLAVGLIGGVFGGINTIPAGAVWLSRALGNISGLPVQIVSDPTDLLGLGASILACWRWNIYTPSPRRSLLQGLAMLSLAGLLTLANAPQPDQGIVCLRVDQGRLIAGSNWYQFYASEDGGLSWEGVDLPDDDSCAYSGIWEGKLTAPDDSQLILGVNEEGRLSESRDGGAIWEPLQDLQYMNQAEIAWLKRKQSANLIYSPGPFAGVVDPGSGNLVFAMGWEGVLVRQPGGDYLRVPVGDYQRQPVGVLNLPELLIREILLIGAYAGLAVLTPIVLQWKSLFQKVWLGVVWLAWLVTLFYFQPARRVGYDMIIVGPGIIFVVGSTLILLGISVVSLWESLKDDLLRTLGFSLVGFAVVLLPFLLWGWGTITDYTLASVFSLLFGLALAAYYFFRLSPGKDDAPEQTGNSVAG